MDLAVSIAARSTCKVPNRNVGCVVVSEDNTKVLSLGYNGSAKGDKNECEYNGDDIKVGGSRCTCVHAEMNSLAKLDTSTPYIKKMYITLSPCSLCYKLIVNAGIDELIFITEYNRSMEAESILDRLELLGVIVRRYCENS